MPNLPYENIAIGIFKEHMIEIILEKDEVQRSQLLVSLQEEMERCILSPRKLQNQERKKNLASKYKTIIRRAF